MTIPQLIDEGLQTTFLLEQQVDVMLAPQISVLLEEFISLLQHHNWNFENSDDSGVWNRGNEELMKLSRMSQKLKDHGVDVVPIWNQFGKKM